MIWRKKWKTILNDQTELDLNKAMSEISDYCAMQWKRFNAEFSLAAGQVYRNLGVESTAPKIPELKLDGKEIAARFCHGTYKEKINPHYVPVCHATRLKKESEIVSFLKMVPAQMQAQAVHTVSPKIAKIYKLPKDITFAQLGHLIALRKLMKKFDPKMDISKISINNYINGYPQCT